MNGLIFRSFRKQNSSQKKTNTVYSEYTYSGIITKERVPRFLIQLSSLESSMKKESLVEEHVGYASIYKVLKEAYVIFLELEFECLTYFYP